MAGSMVGRLRNNNPQHSDYKLVSTDGGSWEVQEDRSFIITLTPAFIVTPYSSRNRIKKGRSARIAETGRALRLINTFTSPFSSAVKTCDPPGMTQVPTARKFMK